MIVIHIKLHNCVIAAAQTRKSISPFTFVMIPSIVSKDYASASVDFDFDIDYNIVVFS